jgi:hypothetical protein
VSDKTELSESKEWARITTLADALARVAELEGAIREHKRAAHDGRSPSALKFADHRKLWSLLPD